ncbi:MAG: putative membrane protein [uncultured archaeon A07HR60]|nr:MAG: putative membrane protein [uncultured archaeon A07HR60]
MDHLPGRFASLGRLRRPRSSGCIVLDSDVPELIVARWNRTILGQLSDDFPEQNRTSILSEQFGESMAVSDVRGRVKRRPRAATAALSLIGYVAVVGVFVSPTISGLFPELTLSQVSLLSDAIAVVNSVTIVTILVGWYYIRRGEVRRHAAAMATSFSLILLFLGMYLPKVAGGGTKQFVGPDLVTIGYLLMLAIHIMLSILAVPVVLHAIILATTHSPRELRQETPHALVGRIAAGTWLLSLSLGVVTYLLLNHVYDWTYEAAVVAVPL